MNKELTPPSRLAELVDTPIIKQVVDDFNKITGTQVVIVDNDGALLSDQRFEPICSDFHLRHPVTSERCKQSSCFDADNPPPDNGKIRCQQCNNGLYQAIAPIMVGHQQFGSCIAGQFLVSEPDINWFSDQARTYNFDTTQYLEALSAIPIITIDELELRMGFIANFASLIGKLGITALRHNQANLDSLENSLKYETVVENTNEAIIISHLDHITFVNTRMSELTGYTKSELLGKRYSSFIHPSTIQSTGLKMIQRDQTPRRTTRGTLGETVPEAFDLEINTKEGLSVWVEVKPVLIDWNNQSATLIFMNDLTGKKKAEKTIQYSEEKFKMILEQSVLGIVLFQDGQYQYINDASLNISGYSREEVLQWRGDDFFATIHPDDIDHILNEHQKARDSGMTDLSFVYRLVTKKGQVKWVEQFEKQVSYNGSPASLMMMNDITKRKNFESEVKESEEKYRNVVDNSAEGICVIQDDQFKYFNPEVVRIFGYPSNELNNTRTSQVFQPVGRNQNESFFAKNNSFQAPPSSYSCQINTKDGLIRWIDFKSVSITWEGQSAELAFISDITEKKQSEELIIQTDKMMSLGGLAGGIAHEINNPLSAIIQATQNISRRLSPDPLANQESAQKFGIDLQRFQEYIKDRKIDFLLDGIKDSGKKAAEIITNILQFSRKSDSKMMMVDLVSLIEKVIGLVNNEYSFKKETNFNKINIIKDFNQPTIHLPCIETEIEQVLLNLLINAAQALSASDPRQDRSITIRAFEQDEMARIEIEDTGPGMDESTRKRVFEPFFTTKSATKGTGLGLSVSYTIITSNHRGSIEARSEKGIGTTFIILLPLDQNIPLDDSPKAIV